MSRGWSIAALALVACTKKESVLEPVAFQRLREHIMSTGRTVATEQMGEERLWTDAAILERARTLPASIETMLTAAPVKPLAARAQAEFLQDADRTRGEWVPAELAREGKTDLDCYAQGGVVRVHLNCVYVNYLEARYPRGQFAVKGKFAPVLLLEQDTVRAAVMPLKD